MAEKLQALALERGEHTAENNSNTVLLIEKSTDSVPKAPSLKHPQRTVIEGHQPREARLPNLPGRSRT